VTDRGGDDSAIDRAVPEPHRPDDRRRGLGGIRRGLAEGYATSRQLLRLVYLDPAHVSERLTLYAAQRLAQDAIDWAGLVPTHGFADRDEVARRLGTRSVEIAATDGAIAGTPFYVALVPGYLNYLWQETRMTLRLAALYGRDPTALHTSAELLWLRGVHPTAEAAEAELVAVRDREPLRPDRRRPLRLWATAVRRLLVFGGFLSPPREQAPTGLLERLQVVVGIALGAAGWVITWVFPVTFMVLMAWGCARHTQQLFERVVGHYSNRDVRFVPLRRERTKRAWLGGGAVALSILIPLAFLAYADHVRNTVGLNLLSGIGVLVALSVVIATMVLGNRRL